MYALKKLLSLFQHICYELTLNVSQCQSAKLARRKFSVRTVQNARPPFLPSPDLSEALERDHLLDWGEAAHRGACLRLRGRVLQEGLLHDHHLQPDLFLSRRHRGYILLQASPLCFVAVRSLQSVTLHWQRKTVLHRYR